MKKTIILLISMATLISCSPAKQKTEPVFTIDSTLQTKVYSILENKLSEINVLSGQAIIMEVQTGQIKALVGLERKDSANYQLCDNFAQIHESGLIQPISILAALETGNVRLSDTVDVGNGLYEVGGAVLKDANWQRGGYGEITIKQGLEVSSNIATALCMQKAFPNPINYFNQLNKMSVCKPDSIKGLKITPCDSVFNDCTYIYYAIGYHKTTPIQMLTFYNAIANNGVMVQPQLYQDSTIVINPQIASKANIDSLKQALQYVVTDGLGKIAYSDKVQIAGYTGIMQITSGSIGYYWIDFCGYFPTDNPQYSIIISIHNDELLASDRLMAGDVFRQIVDYIN